MRVEAAKVFVAESHALIREGLCALLTARDDVELAGEIGGLAEIEGAVSAKCPDVVLMEAEMSLAKDTGVIHRILTASPGVKVLLVDDRNDRERLLRGLRAGACGYISTTADASVLVSAIKAVHKGDYFLYPPAVRTLIDEYFRMDVNASPDPYDQLSRREQTMLRSICRGDSNRQIAESLNISPGTAQRNRTRMMVKLNARSHAELLRFAIRRKVTTIE